MTRLREMTTSDVRIIRALGRACSNCLSFVVWMKSKWCRLWMWHGLRRMITVYLIDGSVTCHTVRLGIFMERVLKNECLIFRRIHRSYAVNVKHIKGRIHNMLQVGNELLTISDSYLDDFNKDVIVVCNPDNKSPKNKKSPNNKDKDK